MFLVLLFLPVGRKGKVHQVILLTPNPLLRNRNERTPSRESANYKDSNTTLHKSSISGASIIENCRTSDTGIIEIIIILKYTMPILFIGPESDHSECLSVTHSLTDS